MSTSEPSTLALPTAGSTLHRLASGVSDLVTAAAFWIGTLLPLVYVPVLALGGLETRPETVGALVALNVVAMVLGHGHNRPD